MKKIAIIQFPGSNCERETKAAFELSPHQVDIVRWNISNEEFDSYDAYILPGGFSYQDRVRAGAISAKLPIIEQLKKADEAGKAILGICNGCQILAEAGLVPGKENLELALGKNSLSDREIGFICDWVYVKVHNKDQNIFTKALSDSAVIPIPVNHGEGRFIFKESFNRDAVSHLKYCNQNGDIIDEFPVNPNGSQENIAGIGNIKGNVFAMMPHPERAAFEKQIPETVRRHSKKGDSTHSDSNQPFDWKLFFARFLSDS